MVRSMEQMLILQPLTLDLILGHLLAVRKSFDILVRQAIVPTTSVGQKKCSSQSERTIIIKTTIIPTKVGDTTAKLPRGISFPLELTVSQIILVIIG